MSRMFCARTRNCRSARSVALDAAWFGLVMPTFLPRTISHCYRGSLVARRKVLPLRGFRSFLGFPIRAVQLANLPRCLGRHAFGAAGVDRGAAHPIAQGLRVAPSLAETAFIPPKCVGTIPGRFICRGYLVAIIPVDQGLWVEWQCRSRQCETAPPSDGSAEQSAAGVVTEGVSSVADACQPAPAPQPHLPRP